MHSWVAFAEETMKNNGWDALHFKWGGHTWSSGWGL